MNPSSHTVSVVILFYSEINLLLFTHCDKVFRGAEFILSFYSINEYYLLLTLLFLKLVNQIESCLFIVSHILVPGLRKFNELHPLSILYIN
jgi:hypothetical protein